jgi:hypothetical protein
LLAPEEAAETITIAGFDQSPLEDIKFYGLTFQEIPSSNTGEIIL